MAYPRSLAELDRWKRLRDPKRYDNGSYQLIQLMGWKWWFEHGFIREYPVGGQGSSAPYYIDMAQPKLKWAIEADGDRYHTDIVKEMQREEYLHKHGWWIQRFRWVDIVNRPDECRRDIIDAWNMRRPLTKDERQALERVTKSQGG